MTPIKRISRETLTQKQLKAVLHYDPDTGVFTWTKSFAGHRQKGKQAGSLGPKYSKGNLVYKQRNIKINGKIYLASRLAWLYMTGEFPTFPTNEIDHINHNPMDNSWTNLRAVNKKMNARNRSLNTNNKSGITGVFWNKNDRRRTVARMELPSTKAPRTCARCLRVSLFILTIMLERSGIVKLKYSMDDRQPWRKKTPKYA